MTIHYKCPYVNAAGFSLKSHSITFLNCLLAGPLPQREAFLVLEVVGEPVVYDANVTSQSFVYQETIPNDY